MFSKDTFEVAPTPSTFRRIWYSSPVQYTLAATIGLLIGAIPIWFLFKPIEGATSYLVSNSKLVLEHRVAKVYQLTSVDTIENFRLVDGTSIDPNYVVDANSIEGMTDTLDSLAEVFSVYGIDMGTLNIFLIPAQFEEDESHGVKPGAYVTPTLSRTSVFISTSSGYGGLLFHEVSHLIWSQYFNGTEFEERYLSFRALGNDFESSGMWKDSIEEVFAEDLGFILSGTPYRDYFPGTPEWLQFDRPTNLTNAPILTKPQVEELKTILKEAVAKSKRH